MRWLALEAGDAATWGSTVITFGMACYAIAQGMSQRRDLRRQNELQAEVSQLQRRQIETAERRTLVMEDLLHRLSAASWQAAPGPPGAWTAPVPAQEPVPSPQGSPPRSAPDGEAPAAEAPAGDVAAEEVADEDFLADREPSAPAGPPGAYGTPQQPHPGPDPFGAVPSGGTRSGSPGPGTDPPPTAAPPMPWGPPPQAAPASLWRVERFGRHSFALRNTGTRTLTGVHVDLGNLPPSARGVPEDSVVRPGEATEFLMAAERGRPLPSTLAVSWHGQPGEVRIPVPPV